MSKEFIWTEPLVKLAIEKIAKAFAYPNQYNNGKWEGLEKEIEKFKAAHSIDVGRDRGKDWEVTELRCNNGAICKFDDTQRDIYKTDREYWVNCYLAAGCGWEIFKVLRKSDGVTFSVGAKDIDGDTIESFEILGGSSMRVNFNNERSLWIEQVKLPPERTIERPPIGIMPMSIWKTTRLNELEEAIIRYVNARKIIPPEWITERDTYISELQETR